MKGKAVNNLRKKLCVIGLVAASVFAGVAAPVAVSTANVEVAEAAGDDYPYKNESNANAADPWSFIKRQCTSFVAWRLRNTNGYTNFTNYNPAPKRKDRSGLYRWGHAYEWGSAARSLGITVDMNPSRGSVFWQNQGVNGAGNYGHVAWVDAVEGDYVWIEEYNYAGKESNYTKRNYDRRKVRKNAASGYIHIKDLTTPPPTPAPDINTYWPLENGYYTIKTAVGARFLDVSGMGTANNVNIQIWDAFGAHSGQIYEVARNGNGTGYYIKNINSGKFVDAKVYNKNAKNGDNVEQYQGDGSNAQQYRLEDAGNGHFYIKNLYNKYLDVAGWVDANGTNVQLWDKADINAQKWLFTRVSGKNLANVADGDYMIYSKVGNKVLNVEGNGKINESNIQIYDPLDVEGNIFTVKSNGNFAKQIINKAANKSVSAANSSSGVQNVYLWDNTNAYARNWYIEDAGDGYVYIRNLWGYYLDVVWHGGNNYGPNVTTYHYLGNDNQKWKLVKYTKTDVTGISLNATGNTLTVGDTYKLNANVAPSNATDKSVRWNSSDPNIATVDLNGNVTAKNPGTAYITVTTNDGSKTATCTVTVLAPVTYVNGISVSPSSKTIEAGKSFTVTATISPSNATNKNKTWSSSNTSVATVDSNGKVTGKKAGTAKITVNTADGGYTASCTVTVKAQVTTGRFSDVSKNAYYYNAVEWAAAKGIATGSNGKFFPNDACTREEAITFLWRMYGKPAPKSMNSKFSDVKNKSRYSYNAIMWGTENGIITGSNGKFAPTATCTREQIITMLWRLTGKPNPRNMTSKFSDVKNTNSYSYKAILWANQNGIATGSNGKFYPATKCKRCEIVTFIYRYSN